MLYYSLFREAFYINNRLSFSDKSTIIHIAIGIGTGAAAVILLMLVCAFALTMSDFEASVAVPLSNACLALGAAVGGLTSALIHRSKGMIMGITVGFILFLIVTLISILVSDGSVTVNTMLRLVIMPILGAVGGIIGVNRSAKRKMI